VVRFKSGVVCVNLILRGWSWLDFILFDSHVFNAGRFDLIWFECLWFYSIWFALVWFSLIRLSLCGNINVSAMRLRFQMFYRISYIYIYIYIYISPSCTERWVSSSSAPALQLWHFELYWYGQLWSQSLIFRRLFSHSLGIQFVSFMNCLTAGLFKPS